jgi:hypothetical protein
MRMVLLWTLVGLACAVLLAVFVLFTVMGARVFSWMIQGVDPDIKDPKVRLRGLLRMVVGFVVLVVIYRFLQWAIGM